MKPHRRRNPRGIRTRGSDPYRSPAFQGPGARMLDAFTARSNATRPSPWSGEVARGPRTPDPSSGSCQIFSSTHQRALQRHPLGRARPTRRARWSASITSPYTSSCSCSEPRCRPAPAVSLRIRQPSTPPRETALAGDAVRSAAAKAPATAPAANASVASLVEVPALIRNRA